ncbi:hypothetical protein [Mumia zhuanghuii]|uniref:Secreted protein n=1 Tax=Mumia zhuanghuii TaxID=2585211 RepID=A0A5C4N3W0_9ACTN|nr:hypothetical protein [Mumia zhuanghuii]TNC52276.1 hypothetical protein FHE65_00470 [Mumia zhuanghuii]
MSVSRPWTRRLAALGAGAALALTPVAAHADTTLGLEHDAVGTSYIKSTGSTIGVGPTTLSTNLNVDNGSFTGHMPLPGTRTKFEVIGFIPVEADVAFVEAAPIQGQISLVDQNTPVTSTASYYIKLSNIKIVGLPTFTGPHCRTKNPVTIPANTPAGGNFNLLEGGTLKGTFTIGDFQNCGLNTWLINLLVPGSGNTIDINVTNGRFA